MRIEFRKLGVSPEDLAHMQKFGLVLDKRTMRKLIKTYESHYTVTLEDIKLLENDLGYKIAKDYASFLMEFNGGFPDKNMVNENIIIDYFFALKTDCEDYSLKFYQENYGEFGLPIATTPSGDYLLLSQNGEILFLDHETDYDHSPLEWIAKSFSELLAMLQ